MCISVDATKECAYKAMIPSQTSHYIEIDITSMKSKYPREILLYLIGYFGVFGLKICQSPFIVFHFKSGFFRNILHVLVLVWVEHLNSFKHPVPIDGRVFNWCKIFRNFIYKRFVLYLTKYFELEKKPTCFLTSETEHISSKWYNFYSIVCFPRLVHHSHLIRSRH